MNVQFSTNSNNTSFGMKLQKDCSKNLKKLLDYTPAYKTDKVEIPQLLLFEKGKEKARLNDFRLSNDHITVHTNNISLNFIPENGKIIHLSKPKHISVKKAIEKASNVISEIIANLHNPNKIKNQPVKLLTSNQDLFQKSYDAYKAVNLKEYV